nr:hypothetical protein [Nakamurella antarctica]
MSASAAESVASTLDPESLTAAVLNLHAQRMTLHTAETKMQARFVRAHPDLPIISVPASARDVYALPDLRRIGAQLAGQHTE